MRVLMVAYACQPGMGSEPGNGWQWASRMSEHHEVHLVTHSRNRTAIESVLNQESGRRLLVSFVGLPGVLGTWDNTPAERYIHIRYVLWQLYAFFYMFGLIRREQFDLVHHVSWATLTGPTLSWLLGVPFVWGPLGGGQLAPLHLKHHLGVGFSRERFRNLRIKAMLKNPWLRLTARSSAIALATNDETHSCLQSLGARRVEKMFDTAVDPDWVPQELPDRSKRVVPVVLWSGRLEAHKAPSLAIEAFAQVSQRHKAELWFLGGGSLTRVCQELTTRLGVSDRVRFLGQVPHNSVTRFLGEADLFLFTSLRDSSGPAVLEAMAWGLPVICLDHQGMRLLPSEIVTRVRVTDGESLVLELASALERLIKDQPARQAIGEAGWHHIRQFHLWPHRIEQAYRIYSEVGGRDHKSAEGRIGAG